MKVLLVALPPLPSLKIKGMHVPLPLVQGGMGIGVSLHPLASAVAAAGGLGLAAITQAARDFARMAREGENRH